MDQKIFIKGREFSYTPQELTYENAKLLDTKIAKENLLLFNEVSKANHFKFILFYGTLLGAIREKNFIKHDTDIDLVTTDENKLLDIIPQLQQKGFQFVRYYIYENKNGILYSFLKNGVYIDIYLATKTKFNKYYLGYSKISKTFIENIADISFLGESFSIPANYEKLFILLYGKDWKVPKKNCPAILPNDHKIRSLFYKLADFFPKKLRNLVKNMFGIKK